jgi:hypothetical protein
MGPFSGCGCGRIPLVTAEESMVVGGVGLSVFFPFSLEYDQYFFLSCNAGFTTAGDYGTEVEHIYELINISHSI